MLGANENNRGFGTDRTNLSSPFLHTVEGVSVVHSNTNEEAVCIVEADLAVDTEVIIAASIVDLQVDLLPLVVLFALEDVEHGRHEVLRENLLLVVNDQAGLTNGGVTH